MTNLSQTPGRPGDATMTVWHEDADFWSTMAPLMFGKGRWEATPGEVDQVAHRLGVEPGDTILDLCCGPGRHALELARRGYAVTGVDITAAYLEQARSQAEEEGLAVEWVRADMRTFCRPDAFDGAIMMFTSFGYFEEPDENRRVLDNVYSSLRKGGALLLELMGKEVLARIFEERVWSEEDGVLFLQEHQISRNWSWMENRWIVVRDQERHEFQVSHWVYSAAELTDLLMGCGFGAVDVYGDLEGALYDHRAKRLVVVARK
jgi:SAM-dependent methyltransferase